MKTWIKTGDGIRFALEDVIGYAVANDNTQVSVRFIGWSLNVTPPDGEGSLEKRVEAYLAELDKALAGLNKAEAAERPGDAVAAVTAFARGLMEWLQERERSARGDWDKGRYRSMQAEVLLRLSEAGAAARADRKNAR